jgi:anti-anti-sigma factor
VASRLSIRPGVEGDLSSPLTLHLTGELDVDTAAGLRESLAVLAGRFEGGALVLDLSGVTFCDPASLYTLLGIRQALPLAGVEVSFSHASAVTLAAADRVGLVERLNL